MPHTPTVFVTGANRGLGLALVKTYLTRGARVFAGRNPHDTPANLDALKESHAEALFLVPLDVTDEKSAADAMAVVGGQAGRLDVLINNAGLTPRYHETAANLRLEDLIAQFKVNACGPAMVIKHAVDLLKKGERPIAATVTSEAGALTTFIKGRNIHSYMISKAAANMLVRCVAFDLAAEGIICLAIQPGWMRTDMGGPNADLDPMESAKHIIENIIDKATVADNDSFKTHTGESHGW